MTLSLLLCRPGTHDPAGALVARVEGASGDVCHVAATDGDVVIEAVGSGVHMVPLERWQLTYGHPQQVPLHLTPDQATAFWRAMRAAVWPPTPYSYGQIAYDAAALLTHRTASAFPGHGCVCSGLIATRLALAGVTPWLPAAPEGIDPQRLSDWAVAQDTKPADTYAAAKLDRDMGHG